MAHGNLLLYRFGIPQKRERFILLATRIASSDEPPRIGLPPPIVNGNRYPPGTTVREVIGVENGFFAIPAGHLDPSDFMHTASGLSTNNLERIRRTPRDGGTRAAWREDRDLQLPAYKGRDGCFSDVYGRMKWDEPSPTITTRFNSLSNGRFGHPEEDRAISLREGATLQTFPTSFAFHGSLQERARQIGNAVPPAFARLLGTLLTRHFKEAKSSNG